MDLPKVACRPALIVDIDETLFDTNRRKIAILRDLFDIQITYAQARADYNLGEYLRDAGQIHAFFREFHSNKYLRFDTPIAHAAEALQHLSATLNIVYLTGRHAEGVEPWMGQRPGTLQSLRRFGFPMPGDGDVVLTMKPTFAGFESIEKQSAADRAHKIKAVSEIVATRRVLAGVGDSFTDLWVYGSYGVLPIGLKRPHWSHFEDRLAELSVQPFVADDWLEIEARVMDLA